MSRFFIDRPIFAAVLSIVIVIIGVVALVKLPIAQYPEVAPPTISVTASFPGANALDLAENVALSLTKGMRVIVTGRLEQRSWETEDGERRYKVEIVADEVGPALRFATVDVHRIERQRAEEDPSSSGTSDAAGDPLESPV